jgi:uncharacterized protein (TIGR02996 family)
VSYAAFLAKIRAKRKDRLPRLVYADWLDEQSDPRGQLIRVEEEMRGLPVTGDRYWTLKKTRTKLRKSADAEWLSAMDYGTHYEPIFHEVPTGWKERFRLAREFLDRWFLGYDLGDVFASRKATFKPPIEPPPKRNLFARGQDTEVKASAITKPFPPAIIEWATLTQEIGKVSILYTEDGYEFQYVPNWGLQILDFYQGRHVFFVKDDDWSTDDPIVHWTEYGDTWGTFPSVSSLALRYVLSLTGNSDATATAAGYAHFGDYPKRIGKSLQNEGLAHSQFDDLEIFESRNLIATIGPDWTGRPSLWVTARKPLTRKDLPPCLRQDFRRYKPHVWGIFA